MMAKQLYTEAVEAGLMPQICPELETAEAGEEGQVRTPTPPNP